MQIPKTLGWLPDKPDSRDIKYQINKELVSKYYKVKEVSVEKWCPQIENQEDIGSCTANTVVENFEFLQYKNTNKFLDASRLFLYYNTRAKDKCENEDCGATLRDTIKCLAKLGIINESKWQYKKELLFKKPPQELYDEALNNRIRSYMRADCSRIAFVSRLLEGFPLAFGMMLYESFFSEQVDKSGLIKPPDTKKEEEVGGHAMLAIGHCSKDSEIYKNLSQKYCDIYKIQSKKCPEGFTRVLNHWGKEWADGGKCWISDDYMFNKKLVRDIWTILK